MSHEIEGITPQEYRSFQSLPHTAPALTVRVHALFAQTVLEQHPLGREPRAYPIQRQALPASDTTGEDQRSILLQRALRDVEDERKPAPTEKESLRARKRTVAQGRPWCKKERLDADVSEEKENEPDEQEAEKGPDGLHRYQWYSAEKERMEHLLLSLDEDNSPASCFFLAQENGLPLGSSQEFLRAVFHEKLLLYQQKVQAVVMEQKENLPLMQHHIARVLRNGSASEIESVLSFLAHTAAPAVKTLIQEQKGSIKKNVIDQLLSHAIDTNDTERLEQIHELIASLKDPLLNSEQYVLYALRHGRYEMASALVRLGATPPRDLEGLQYTIKQGVETGRPEIVRCLKECLRSALTSENAQHVFNRAMMNGEKSVVRALAAVGVPLDSIGPDGFTPLTLAIYHDKTDMVDLLLQLGANPNQHTRDFYTPAIAALLKQNLEIIALLSRFGCDLEKSETFLQLKFVSHVWGLSGSVNFEPGSTIPLEGFSRELTLPLLSSYARIFFQESEQSLPPELVSTISITLQKAMPSQGYATILPTPECIASDIQSGKPTYMLLSLHGHTIGLVFSQNTLSICNRGKGMSPHAIEIYTITPSRITPEFIQHLQDKSLIDEMEELMHLLQRLDPHPVGGIDQKKQQVGNCTWVNAESAFLALLFAVTEKSISDPSQRLSFCRSLYKQFTTFARIQSLRTYLQLPNPNKEILRLIKAKLEVSTHIIGAERSELLQQIEAKLL